jgi:surface antigen
MSWSEFLNIPNGETVFNHGASECVALANQYNEGVLGGGFVQVGSALQWWTNTNVATVHGFDRIDSAPQVGDIFIASGDIYNNQFGHIGVVVRAWDGSTFGTMEQNVYGEFVSRHDRTMANMDGFLRPINQAPLTPPAPSLLATQRQAGTNGANRRAAPSASAELLEPNLEANEVGNFVNFAHAEDPYGTGNDVWFQGVSGNWFYSGAFTDAGTHDLNDVTVQAPAPVTPTPEPPAIVLPPEPTPEPVTPPKEEVVITIDTDKTKEIIVSTPTAAPQTPAELQAAIARQNALVAGVKPADLGSIITHAVTRKVVWAVYGLTGLFIIAIMGGLTAAQWIAPEWFIFATGAYTAIGPAFASLAVANIDTQK